MQRVKWSECISESKAEYICKRTLCSDTWLLPSVSRGSCRSASTHCDPSNQLIRGIKHTWSEQINCDCTPVLWPLRWRSLVPTEGIAMVSSTGSKERERDGKRADHGPESDLSVGIILPYPCVHRCTWVRTRIPAGSYHLPRAETGHVLSCHIIHRTPHFAACFPTAALPKSHALSCCTESLLLQSH